MWDKDKLLATVEAGCCLSSIHWIIGKRIARDLKRPMPQSWTSFPCHSHGSDIVPLQVVETNPLHYFCTTVGACQPSGSLWGLGFGGLWDLTGQSSEQPCLSSAFTLLGAGGWIKWAHEVPSDLDVSTTLQFHKVIAKAMHSIEAKASSQGMSWVRELWSVSWKWTLPLLPSSKSTKSLSQFQILYHYNFKSLCQGIASLPLTVFCLFVSMF